MTKNKIITFTQDTKERKKYFKAASFAHPAKMHLSLQIYLIEHYTKPGDTILDPMAGSGTILFACTLGRNVVCVELEDKFIKMQQDNYKKIRSLGPMLGFQLGEARILQGDARNLNGLLADNIVFSPPYAETSGDTGKTDKKLVKDLAEKFGRKSWVDSEKTPFRDKSIPDNPANISNLPYGSIEAAIFSPPYEGSLARDRSQDESYKEDREKKHAGGSIAISKGYKADAVITSPPYEKAQSGGGISATMRGEGKYQVTTSLPASCYQPSEHGQDKDNIGNLKSENYLQAMFQVYCECRKVLKPEGLLVLVVKNFIRDKKIVRLDLDTIKLCEQAGFKLIDRLYRKLTQQSFWRIIYHQKFPDVPKIEYEDVLILIAASRPDGSVE